jgi:hypothetical protein
MVLSPKAGPKPLSEPGLRQFIIRAVTKGLYGETPHACDDHPERGICEDDVLSGLRRKDWKLLGSHLDGTRGIWRYKIQTVDLDGDELILIVAVFPADSRIKVVTRW